MYTCSKVTTPHSIEVHGLLQLQTRSFRPGVWFHRGWGDNGRRGGRRREMGAALHQAALLRVEKMGEFFFSIGDAGSVWRVVRYSLVIVSLVLKLFRWSSPKNNIWEYLLFENHFPHFPFFGQAASKAKKAGDDEKENGFWFWGHRKLKKVAYCVL